MKDKKVIFMGTPDFSVPVLKMLIENTNVIGVVTQPDKVNGRGNSVSFSPVKKVAIENNIKVFQPIKIRKEYEDILAMEPDIIITCAYGQIIPSVILDYPKYGCVNVHASLLPELRGGAPLHHAIIDGYSKTGMTIMYMAPGMDDGDIITQKEVILDDSYTVGKLHDEMSNLGASLLLETLPSIFNGTNNRIKQDPDKVTFGLNIKPEEEIIDFSKDSRTIFNQVRGLNPFPGAYFKLNNEVYKIYECSYDLGNFGEPGVILECSKKNFSITTSDGKINILNLKKEGKKRMNVIDFLNGNHDNLEGTRI